VDDTDPALPVFVGHCNNIVFNNMTLPLRRSTKGSMWRLSFGGKHPCNETGPFGFTEPTPKRWTVDG
jgi:hypothetical protein